MPAIAIGFDSQGKGLTAENSQGTKLNLPVFSSASKNFELFGYLSIHGVINYSMERDDADKDLNLGIGFENNWSKVSFIGEYDFAVNDNTGNSLGKEWLFEFWSSLVGWGWTNTWSRFTDFLNNKRIDGNKADRGIFVEYVKSS